MDTIRLGHTITPLVQLDQTLAQATHMRLDITPALILRHTITPLGQLGQILVQVIHIPLGIMMDIIIIPVTHFLLYPHITLTHTLLDTTLATHTLQGTMRDMDIIIIPLETLMDLIQQMVLEISPTTMQQFPERTTMRDMDTINMVPELRMDHIQQTDISHQVIIMATRTPLDTTLLSIHLVIILEIITIQLMHRILVSQAITQQFIMQVIMLVHIQLLTTTPPVQLDQTLALAHHIQLVITLEHIHTPQLPLTLQQAQ